MEADKPRTSHQGAHGGLQQSQDSKLSASDALKQALRDAGCADQVFEDGEGEEEEEQGGDGESETESFTEVFQTATSVVASGQHVQVQAAGDVQLVSVAAGDAGVEYFHYADPGEGVGGAMQGTLQEGPQGQVQIEWTYRGVPTNVPVLVEREAGGEGNMEQAHQVLVVADGGHQGVLDEGGGAVVPADLVVSGIGDGGREGEVLHLRPDLTWPQLIAEALEGAPGRTLSTRDVFLSIESSHPFFQGLTDPHKESDKDVMKWHKLIRGTLRDNKNFDKIIQVHEGGRESISWTMDEGTKGLLFARHNNASWFLKGKGATKQRDKSKNNEKWVGYNPTAKANNSLPESTRILPDGSIVTLDSSKPVKRKGRESCGGSVKRIRPRGKDHWTKKDKSKDSIHQYWTSESGLFGENLLKCIYPTNPACTYTCKSLDNMKGHVNTVHVKKVMYCNICGRPYLSYRILKEHFKGSHKMNCYRCTFEGCKFQSVDTDLIAEHYANKHNTTDVPQEYWPIDPSLHREWKEKKEKVNTKPKAEPSIEEAFESRGKKYPPAIEQMIAAKLKTCQNPDGTLLQQRVWSCKLCDHTVSKKQNVAAHVKVKHLNQQQKCPEAGSGCPFVTGYENNMRAHLKLVHKWEEITCMIPDCTFKTVVDQKMQDHLTKVHNARYDEATHALVCFA